MLAAIDFKAASNSASVRIALVVRVFVLLYNVRAMARRGGCSIFSRRLPRRRLLGLILYLRIL